MQNNSKRSGERERTYTTSNRSSLTLEIIPQLCYRQSFLSSEVLNYAFYTFTNLSDMHEIYCVFIQR